MQSLHFPFISISLNYDCHMFQRLKIHSHDIDVEFTEIDKKYIGYIGVDGEIKPEQIPRKRAEPLNGIDEIPDEHYTAEYLPKSTAAAPHSTSTSTPVNKEHHDGHMAGAHKLIREHDPVRNALTAQEKHEKVAHHQAGSGTISTASSISKHIQKNVNAHPSVEGPEDLHTAVTVAKDEAQFD